MKTAAHKATLGQMAQRRAELLAECLNPDCGAETPLSTSFFLPRFGVDTSLGQLAKHIVCTACGSKVELFPANDAD